MRRYFVSFQFLIGRELYSGRMFIDKREIPDSPEDFSSILCESLASKNLYTEEGEIEILVYKEVGEIPQNGVQDFISPGNHQFVFILMPEQLELRGRMSLFHSRIIIHRVSTKKSVCICDIEEIESTHPGYRVVDYNYLGSNF